MKKNTYWIVPLLMVLGLGLSGCTDRLRADRGNMPSGQTHTQTPDDGEWTPYTIEFNASDMITPSLRSLTEEGENDIQGSVRVLVFDNSNHFEYEAPVTSVTPGNTGKKATGKVQLLLKNTAAAQYKFVMLANLPANTPDASGFSNKSYAEVMKQFTYTMPQNGEWENGHLPMWGEITAVVNHNSGANPQIGTIKLIRAVARIDVGLNLTAGTSQFNETASGITGITLTSVKFFNMNRSGTIAPEGSLDTSESDKPKVTTPTLPNPAPEMTDLTFGSSKINGQKLLQRSVYVPEASNAPTEATQSANGETLPESDQDRYLKRPYMVVGLTGADKRRPTQVTYFRIDFLKKTGDEATATYEYLHLLRNYRYLVNITNVGGPGFDSEEDAKKGPAANIMYNVVVWNESDMTNVQYDGQYMLGVSEDNLTYYNHAYSKKIIVRTSWPGGWNAAVTKGNDWIAITPNTGSVGTDVTMEISVKANNEDDAVDRNGIVTITAGRMTWNVNVKQLSEGEVSLEIYEYDTDGTTLKPEPISMLNFTGNGGTKKIAVKYAPTNAPDGTPPAEGYSGPIDLGLKDFRFTKQESSSPGMAVYDVTVGSMSDEDDYFESITAVANFTIRSNGKAVSKALVLQQTEYNAIPYESMDFNKLIEFVETPSGKSPITHSGSIPFFLMDGKPGDHFVIKANTRYNIKMISTSNKPQVKTADNQGLHLIENGFPLNDEVLHKQGKFAGEEFGFTTADDLKALKRFLGYVEFEITSPDGLFEPRTFKLLVATGIMQPEANTYLMKPGYIGIIIPVSQIDKAARYYNKFESGFKTYMNQNTKNLSSPPRTWNNNFKLPELDRNKPWTVEVLWAEVMNTYNGGPVVSKTDPNRGVLYILTEAGKDYIFVMPSYNYTGNVIIGLKQNGVIMWSWHLWLVNTYPSENPLSNNGQAKWLDRDLGAFGVTIRAQFDNNQYEQHGLLYQWGRKDPFPLLGVNQITHRNTKLIKADGQDYYLDFMTRSKHLQSVGTMKEMINNPTIYYSSGREPRQISPFLELPDNYRGVTFQVNDAYAALWGGVALSTSQIGFDKPITPTKKTPFDPSPYGWKVPNSGSEANWGRYRPKLSKTQGGSDFYKEQKSPHFPYMSNSDTESFRWTSTRMTNNVGGRYICGVGTPQPAKSTIWSTSAGIMVRSVYNEKENDYENYLPKIKVKKK